MPSTITTYYSFTPNTKARSSEVNANFNNHRGTLVPINSDTATASDGTHHLGTDEHRWLGVFSNYLDLERSTSTATTQLRGDTSATAGAFLFQIASVTVAQITPSGFDLQFAALGSLDITGMTTTSRGDFKFSDFTASGSWTVPAHVNNICIMGVGGGGGGGGGGYSAGSGGGGGGGGSAVIIGFYPVTPLSVLSITVGQGGSIGFGESAGGAASAGGTGTSSIVAGVASGAFRAQPGFGGAAGATSSADGGLSNYTLDNGVFYLYYVGGFGRSGGTTGNDGGRSPYVASNIGGTGGTGETTFGGGGGGGASWAQGGNGGAGEQTFSGGTGVDGGYGAGGGGGGAGNAGGGRGGAGGGGYVRIIYVGTTDD